MRLENYLKKLISEKLGIPVHRVDSKLIHSLSEKMYLSSSDIPSSSYGGHLGDYLVFQSKEEIREIEEEVDTFLSNFR